MIGAYTATEHFAYPGWRLTVPGGPAGGHYKGFTHTQAAGTTLLPQDQYEQDRGDGMSAHDAVHASPRNPRGVYRSSGEVPPRPNASGSAMTYRGFQTARHPGTSIAPGAFPAPFEETDEDAFLARYGATQHFLQGLGVSELIPAGIFTDGGPWPGPMPMPPDVPCDFAPPPEGCHYEAHPSGSDPCAADLICLPGATNVVRQTPPTRLPLPPSPRIYDHVAVPISPRPAPIVRTREVVPDGSGNYLDIATGATVPAHAVTQNPATGTLHASAGVMSWLEEHSIFSMLPNWGVLAGGLLAASMLLGKRR